MIDPRPLRRTDLRHQALRFAADNPRALTRLLRDGIAGTSRYVGDSEFSSARWRQVFDVLYNDGMLTLIRSSRYRTRWGTGDVILSLEGERTLAEWDEIVAAKSAQSKTDATEK